MGSARAVAALVLLVLVFDPQTSYLLLEEDSPFFTGALEQTIGVFTAIYLITHGLNNMEKDLPSKWRDVWDRTFHPGREKAGSEPPWGLELKRLALSANAILRPALGWLTLNRCNRNKEYRQCRNRCWP
jgi:hypothetical protein